MMRIENKQNEKNLMDISTILSTLSDHVECFKLLGSCKILKKYDAIQACLKISISFVKLLFAQ